MLNANCTFKIKITEYEAICGAFKVSEKEFWSKIMPVTVEPH